MNKILKSYTIEKFIEIENLYPVILEIHSLDPVQPPPNLAPRSSNTSTALVQCLPYEWPVVFT